MSLNYRNTVLAQSPIAYYTLDEVTGNTYADSVGSNDLTDFDNLITQGITPASGLDGFAVQSPGGGPTITGTISGIPTGTGDAVTVTGWIYWDGDATATPLLWGWDNATDVGFIGAQFGFNTGAGDCYGFTWSGAFIENGWNHLAVVYYNNQAYDIANKIYLNGANQTLSLSGGPGNSLTTTTVWLMGWGAGTANRFAQPMDEVAYFDRELDAGEVQAQFDAEFDPSFTTVFGQAQADIKAISNAFANSQGDIKVTKNVFANAQGYIQNRLNAFAQAQADIKLTEKNFANAQAFILGAQRQFAQAQGKITGGTANAFAQAQGDILVTSNRFANAQAQISAPAFAFGLARAKVLAVTGYFGQAQAFIGHFKYGQAQAFISGLGARHTGLAQGSILRGPTSTPIDPSNSADVTYLVQFNGYAVPGYLQEETFDSIENTQTYYTTYVDGSTTDPLGLANKQITLKEKLIGASYLDVKNQAQRAAVILNSTRRFARLYIQSLDKYYLAMAKTVAFDQEASAVGKTLDYTIEFEAKPWQFDTITQTLTGTGTLTTTGRTVYDGGWTPTTVRVTGTDVTISGFTENGDYAGYISVSGSVTDLIIDTEASSATIAGLNRSDVINNLDYWLYVGEGVTSFDVTGASSCEITWVNRWHL